MSTYICLGPKNAGKTHLLSSMQCPGAINKTSHSVPTVGTNLFTIKLPANATITAANSTATVAAPMKPKKTKKNQQILVREVGGTMAPMWKNYLTDVGKIMYVVDTSNLCQISAAGVLLYSLLAEPRLQHAKVLLVLTKMDLAYRQMRNEALLMMQFEKLKKQIRQHVTVVEASALNEMGHTEILNWLGDVVVPAATKSKKVTQ